MAPAGGGAPSGGRRRRRARLRRGVREPRRLVASQDDPGAIVGQVSTASGSRAVRAERKLRLAPAEQVAGAEPAGCHRRVAGRFGLPGEFQRSRGDQPALPVTRRQVGGGHSSAGRRPSDQLRSPLLGLAPQEVGGFGDVARLVEEQERAGTDVVEAGRRGELGRPDLGRVADRDRPGTRPPGADGAGIRGELRTIGDRRALEPGRDPRQAARGAGQPAARARARMASRPLGGGRNSEAGRRTNSSTVPIVRWSAGSKRRSDSISSPKNSIRTGSSDDGGKRSTMPPRRANSPRPATSSTG